MKPNYHWEEHRVQTKLREINSQQVKNKQKQTNHGNLGSGTVLLKNSETNGGRYSNANREANNEKQSNSKGQCEHDQAEFKEEIYMELQNILYC